MLDNCYSSKRLKELGDKVLAPVKEKECMSKCNYFLVLVQEGTNAIRYTSSYVMKDYLTKLDKAIKYSTMTVCRLC